MTKWQYELQEVKPNEPLMSLGSVLNTFGSVGFELTGVLSDWGSGSLLVFKRPLVEQKGTDDAGKAETVREKGKGQGSFHRKRVRHMHKVDGSEGAREEGKVKEVNRTFGDIDRSAEAIRQWQEVPQP